MSAGISVDGKLSDWTAADRLDTPSTGVQGYEAYGKLDTGNYTVALKSSIAIGPNTTFWLNSDMSASTGYQIFGWSGGAEYRVEIDADSVPRLYQLQAGGPESGTLVSSVNLQYAFSSDSTVLEFAIPQAQLAGSPSSIGVLLDVNNQVFLPNNYANQYTIKTPVAHINDNQLKVGIVYSETSASKYFSSTAYSDLFMAAQSQAVMAGIPYDVLTEADLKNIDTLKQYDTLIFPSFTNVKQADLSAIQGALTDAVYKYGISLIAAGNFMTNDETGAALAGDSYARMKQLLGVERLGGDNVAAVTVTATANGAPVIGYNAGEIRTYLENATSKVGTAYFGGVDGSAQVVATQTTSGGTVDGTYNAVLATQTGGKNVFFATEGMLADSNMLGNALDYTIQSQKPAAPELSLQMSRQSSLFASRTDMDQSQEQIDVNGGIYDTLLPILQQWKSDYNFVGSYYVNVGDRPNEGQATDWSKSKLYYEQLLALGNEIGSHSYTHPENTNALTAEQIKFEFEASKALIQQQLGIQVLGAAVPGAPETVQTANEILQYYSYVTGGYSGIGAGYPNAFGFLQPGDTSKVYIAPNLKFDFSLVEAAPEFGGGLTAEQAKQEWIREFDELSLHSDLPVFVWPWHDYGPTQWMVAPSTPSPYTPSMYTDFIAYAYSKGSEFVTLAELADRIRAFEQAEFNYTFDSMTATITATVTSTNVGDFALDLGDAQTIASVSGWFAYDEDSVFLGANGGTYTIKLGAPQDVTHITSLPMRAELQSTEGDGRNLKFSVIGEGTVVIDLADPAGHLATVTGAEIVSQVGDRLELKLVGSSLHTVTVGLPPVLTLTSGLLKSDTGDSSTDFVTKDGRVELTGSVSANASVAIFDGDQKLGDAVLTAGTWTFSYELGEGSHHLKVVATDANLVTTTVEPPYSFTIDKTAPTLTLAAVAGDDVVNQGESAVVALTGTAPPSEAGRTVTVRVIGAAAEVVATYAAVVGSDGAWSVPAGAAPASGRPLATLENGSYQAEVSLTDSAGNTGVIAHPFMIAKAGDDLGNLISLSLVADTGSSAADFITSDGRVVVTGSAQAGTAVAIFDNGIKIADVAVTDNAWTWSSDLGEGTHQITTSFTDANSNVKTTAAPNPVVVDQTPPALAPTVDAGRTTQLKSGAFTIKGHAEANSLVKVYDGAHLLGTTQASSGGTWSLATKKLVGKHSFWATDEDIAGNVSGRSGAFIYGTASSEKLTGTTGSDVFQGRGGSDAFAFKGAIGQDVIRDFAAEGKGHDVLQFDIGLFSGFSSVLRAAKNVGNNVVIKAGNGQSVTLVNVSKSDLDEVDFRFTGKSVVGTAARNTLTSTDANEIFTGKAGADSFVFKAGFGKDVIRDFDEGTHRGHDYLRFSKALFTDFDSVMSASRQVGSDVVITAAAGDSLTLWDVKKHSLTADDFRFF